jgi:hypothetical protein
LELTTNKAIIILITVSLLALSGMVVSAHAQEEVEDNSPTGLIQEIFEFLRVFFQDWVSGGDIESYDNPLGTTNDELETLTDNAVNSGKAGAELFFSLEETTISLIQVLSPIELSITIISVIALGVTLLVIFKLFHGMAKHMLIVMAVVVFIIILLMAVNVDIAI